MHIQSLTDAVSLTLPETNITVERRRKIAGISPCRRWAYLSSPGRGGCARESDTTGPGSGDGGRAGADAGGTESRDASPPRPTRARNRQPAGGLWWSDVPDAAADAGGRRRRGGRRRPRGHGRCGGSGGQSISISDRLPAAVPCRSAFGRPLGNDSDGAELLPKPTAEGLADGARRRRLQSANEHSRVGGPGRPPTARSPRSGACPSDYGIEPARAIWSDATPAGARRGHPRRGARRSLPGAWSSGREATPLLRARVHHRHRRGVATCDNAPALCR